MNKILLLAALLAAPAAQAQVMVCFSHEKVTAQLTADGKTHVGQGVANSGTSAIEMWVSPDTGDWAFVYVRASDGLSCVRATGASWEFFLSKKGAPA